MIRIASGKKNEPKTKYGYYAVVLGLCGICCCGCILVPLAFHYSLKGMREDFDPGMAKIGLVLSFIGLCCWIISFIILGIFLVAMM
ncbi:MAG: hypothetical protein ACFFCI_00960 [Promethearchaeota archaeon]